MISVSTYETIWEPSFVEAKRNHSYNTTAPEALARTASYFLRNHASELPEVPSVLDLGCGAGETLVYFARRGFNLFGIDIAPTAVELAKQNLADNGHLRQVRDLRVGSIVQLPYDDNSFDLCTEAMVFQHLEPEDRRPTLKEIRRVLRPGGALIAYGHAREGHTVFNKYKHTEHPSDPGSITLRDPGAKLTDVENIGLVHFFSREEWEALLSDFSSADLMLETYQLPREEARRRGYDEYQRAHWIVYARK
ncbi:MAG TPA: class I SAM-dependent methyltransferase [Blastocatellia bacterium]|nr:class I SAM-dependent methyltransferase [Blastocatellia bacterium]